MAGGMSEAAARAASMQDDTGLACLAIVARFHGKAAQPAQLAYELGISGPARAEDLLLAARRLELKARLGRIDLTRGRAPLPCILEVREPSTPGEPPAIPGFLVLAALDAHKALLHDPALADQKSPPPSWERS